LRNAKIALKSLTPLSSSIIPIWNRIQQILLAMAG